MDLPIIGITMGDPSGIGPEISVKALTEELYNKCRPVFVGDVNSFNQAAKLVGKPIKFVPIKNISEAKFTPGTVEVFDVTNKVEVYPVGKVSAESGDIAFRSVVKVIDLAMKGEIAATVTNPLNKAAMNLAGHHFSGHTEVYATYTKTPKYSMMLAHENLRVVHVSTHVALREACNLVKKDRVLEVIRLANEACKQLGIDLPKVGVAGLNPHSGEGGLFGSEEIEEIIPAITAAKEEGINADGPVPPDTVFSKARGGWYDIVVAMYHDQGHIPLKVVGFVYNQEKGKWDDVSGVNITLGLPIIRASVDHGTAFDNAGKNISSPISLENAIDYAIMMAKNKK
jgi:4-hydroxythreonine-4-phosphate dehydrogenase